MLAVLVLFAADAAESHAVLFGQYAVIQLVARAGGRQATTAGLAQVGPYRCGEAESHDTLQ